MPLGLLKSYGTAGFQSYGTAGSFGYGTAGCPGYGTAGQLSNEQALKSLIVFPLLTCTY